MPQFGHTRLVPSSAFVTVLPCPRALSGLPIVRGTGAVKSISGACGEGLFGAGDGSVRLCYPDGARPTPPRPPAEQTADHADRRRREAAQRQAIGPAQGHDPAAGRQVDLAPGADAGRARRRRDHRRGAARGRRRARHGRGDARLRRHGHAHRAGRVAGGRARRRRAARAGARHRLRQCRHRRPPGHGHRRQPQLRHHLHRRRLAGRPADGPRLRSAPAHGRAGPGPLRRPAAGDHQGAGRAHPDRLPPQRAVGAGEVGGAAGRAQLARRHHHHRAGGDARPHRAHAGRLRRGNRDRDRRRRQPGDQAGRRAGAEAADHRRAERSEFGGVHDRGGADRRRLGRHHRERPAQPDAHRPHRNAQRRLAPGRATRRRRNGRRPRHRQPAHNRRRGSRRRARPRQAAERGRCRPPARRR